MRFNQVIWDALCFAAFGMPYRQGFVALEHYAAACDGKVRIVKSMGDRPIVLAYEFSPNPIGKY
jgi:hypothetical protein